MANQTPFELVGEFHEVFGHSINPEPTVLDAKSSRLRLNLILEEAAELIEAVGGEKPGNLHLSDAAKRIRAAMKVIETAPDHEFRDQDLVGIADALTDILYVTNGGGQSWGLDLDACFQEVHASNMTKLGEDGKPIYNPETGKVIKGPGYREPDLVYALGLDREEEEVAS